MMVMLLGELADAVGIGKCVAKILKRILLFEMMLLHHAPTGAKLLLKFLKLLPFQWRHASLARNTVLLGQVTHSRTLLRRTRSGKCRKVWQRFHFDRFSNRITSLRLGSAACAPSFVVVSAAAAFASSPASA